MRAALLASTALLASAVAAQAQTWTGNTSTDWFTGTNWSGGAVPGGGEQPTIDTTTPHAPVIDGATAPATGVYPQIFIGDNGTGGLTIQNAGGILNADNAFIGNNAGANGTVTMTGGAVWNSTNASTGIAVGYNGTGTFNVSGGSTVNTVNTILGFGAHATGTVTVDASTWNQMGAAPLSALFVGYGGTGTFTVRDGGTVAAADTYVGHLAGSTGTATVTGVGSSWTANSVFIGNSGNGTFNVQNGATLTANADSFVGYAAGSTGTLNVDGAGSKFSLLNNSLFFIGGSGLSGTPSGTGIVNVTNGGTLDMNGTVTYLGVSGGTGTMNFDASTWNVGSAVAVGFSGTGTVTIANGSVAQLNGEIVVGDCACATGTVTVTGAGSQFLSVANLDVLIGAGGKGTFNVQDGASASFLSNVVLGHDSGSSGTLNVQSGGTFTTNTNNLTVGFNGTGAVTVDGLGSQLTTNGLFVGDNRGTGTMNITNGGVATVNGVIGLGNNHPEASGTVTVSGGGSQFNSTDVTSGDIAIGVDGTGTFNVLNGATANFATDVVLAFDGGSGTLNVQGPGSVFTVTGGGLIVGNTGGTGTVKITDGGVVNTDGTVIVGDCDCATGTITVSGGGSQFNSTTADPFGVAIGNNGNGTLNVLDGGSATFNTDVYLGAGFGTGTLNVQNGTFATTGGLILGFGNDATVTVSGATSAFNVGTQTVIGDGGGVGTFNVLDGATANLATIQLGQFSPGTLKIDATSQVTGNGYTQTPVGTFNVGISPTGNGKVAITGGDINLDGALVVSAKTTLAKKYDVMTTNGNVFGTFSSISVVGNANNLQVTYGVPCGGLSCVELSVDTFSLVNNLPPGLTGNPKHVVDALDTAIASGITIPDAFFNVFALNGDNLVNALSQLSGEPATGATQSDIQLMNSFLSLLLNPYGGAPAGNPGTLSYAREIGPGNISPEAAAAYAAVTPRDRRAEPAAAPWSVWGQAYGGYNKADGSTSAGTHDSTARTYGLATGFDYRVSGDTTAGFALAGAGENWGLSDGLGGGRGEAFQLGAYASKQYGAAYLSGALAYAIHNMTTDRTLTLAGSDHLTANFTAQSVGGRVETGYRMVTAYMGITPYAAAQVQGFFTPNYSENAVSGSNVFALTFKSQSTVASRTELGAWLDKTIAFDDGRTLGLRGRVAWANDQSSNNALTATFQTLPGASFTVNGAAPSTNLALLTAGAEYRLSSNVSLGAKLDGEFGSRSETYAGTASVRYTW